MVCECEFDLIPFFLSLFSVFYHDYSDEHRFFSSGFTFHVPCFRLRVVSSLSYWILDILSFRFQVPGCGLRVVIVVASYGLGVAGYRFHAPCLLL